MKKACPSLVLIPALERECQALYSSDSAFFCDPKLRVNNRTDLEEGVPSNIEPNAVVIEDFKCFARNRQEK